MLNRENGERAAGDSPTVAEGWDRYGRRWTKKGKRVGDAWGRPKLMGLDVERDEDVVPFLDREIFSPFLGTSDVIVEIGPGGGRFTEVLLPKCQALHAVDTSPAMIEQLHERFRGDSRLRAYVGDGGLGMLENESADAAFSYGVFVHLQHWDIFNYLTEIERILRPGGKAIVQHSNTFSEIGWKKFRGEVPNQINRHKLSWTFVVNTPELMAEFIRRAGLEPVDMITDIVRRDCIALIRKPA